MATKKAAGSNEGAKKPSALSKPVQPSAELAKVVGKDPMPRTEVTKKIWDYIKKNNLQDSQNRRMINADDNLRPIFGKDQVSMFEMTKLVNQHLK
jgi:chromatin remodeling complex protein RSC6